MNQQRTLSNIRVGGWYKLVFTALVVVLHSSGLYSQFKSLDFEISTSPYLDDHRDREYNYEAYTLGNIAHFTIGGSKSISQRLVISPRIAYSFGLQSYINAQFAIMGGSLEDRTHVEKSKRASFLKIGTALSYWIHEPGKGLFIEGELQNLFVLGAVSHETRIVGSGLVEEFDVDFKDNVRTSVPSMRLGVGFNIPIKRVGLFIRISQEFLVSTYFRDTNNYSFMNRSIGLGFRYVLEDVGDEG